MFDTVEKVTSGRVYAKAFFNNFPPLKETYDFCYLLSFINDIQCPIPAGKWYNKWYAYHDSYTHHRWYANQVLHFCILPVSLWVDEHHLILLVYSMYNSKLLNSILQFYLAINLTGSIEESLIKVGYLICISSTHKHWYCKSFNTARQHKMQALRCMYIIRVAFIILNENALYCKPNTRYISLGSLEWAKICILQSK